MLNHAAVPFYGLETPVRNAADLRFAEIDQILQGDLHDFLCGVLERCGQVSRAVQDQYSLR